MISITPFNFLILILLKIFNKKFQGLFTLEVMDIKNIIINTVFWIFYLQFNV